MYCLFTFGQQLNNLCPKIVRSGIPVPKQTSCAHCHSQLRRLVVDCRHSFLTFILSLSLIQFGGFPSWLLAGEQTSLPHFFLSLVFVFDCQLTSFLNVKTVYCLERQCTPHLINIMFNDAQVDTFSRRKPRGWGKPLSLCFLRPMLEALCLASLLFSVISWKPPFPQDAKFDTFFRNFTDSLTFTFLFSFFTLDVFSRSIHKKPFHFVFKLLKIKLQFFSGSCLSIEAGPLVLLPKKES